MRNILSGKALWVALIGFVVSFSIGYNLFARPLPQQSIDEDIMTIDLHLMNAISGTATGTVSYSKGGASCGSGSVVGESTGSVDVCCAYTTDSHGNAVCVAYQQCKQTTLSCGNLQTGETWTSTGSPYSCLACPVGEGGDDFLPEFQTN